MSYENLSALLDGECSAQELDRLLEDLERSPGLKAQWSRLCLTRDAIEGTHIVKNQPCICASVMAALDEMPAELANPKVVELRRPRSMIWKQVAGLAAAASVAVVALLVGVNGHRQSVAGLTDTARQSVTAPVTEAVSYPVAPRPARNLQSVALRADGEQQWQDAGDDLDNYLIEHNSSLANQGVGMGGTLRAARFAAHSATYHPEQGQP
jgi:negative regulator of sigma E activity